MDEDGWGRVRRRGRLDVEDQIRGKKEKEGTEEPQRRRCHRRGEATWRRLAELEALRGTEDEVAEKMDEGDSGEEVQRGVGKGAGEVSGQAESGEREGGQRKSEPGRRRSWYQAWQERVERRRRNLAEKLDVGVQYYLLRCGGVAVAPVRAGLRAQTDGSIRKEGGGAEGPADDGSKRVRLVVMHMGVWQGPPVALSRKSRSMLRGRLRVCSRVHTAAGGTLVGWEKARRLLRQGKRQRRRGVGGSKSRVRRTTANGSGGKDTESGRAEAKFLRWRAKVRWWAVQGQWWRMRGGRAVPDSSGARAGTWHWLGFGGGGGLWGGRFGWGGQGCPGSVAARLQEGSGVVAQQRAGARRKRGRCRKIEQKFLAWRRFVAHTCRPRCCGMWGEDRLWLDNAANGCLGVQDWGAPGLEVG